MDDKIEKAYRLWIESAESYDGMYAIEEKTAHISGLERAREAHDQALMLAFKAGWAAGVQHQD